MRNTLYIINIKVLTCMKKNTQNIAKFAVLSLKNVLKKKLGRSAPGFLCATPVDKMHLKNLLSLNLTFCRKTFEKHR